MPCSFFALGWTTNTSHRLIKVGHKQVVHQIQEDDDYRSAGSPKAGCCGKDGGQSGGKASVPRFFGITRHQLKSSPIF